MPVKPRPNLSLAFFACSARDCAYPGIETSPDGDLFVVYYSCSQTIDENLRMGPGPLPGKYSPCSIYLARVVMD